MGRPLRVPSRDEARDDVGTAQGRKIPAGVRPGARRCDRGSRVDRKLRSGRRLRSRFAASCHPARDGGRLSKQERVEAGAAHRATRRSVRRSIPRSSLARVRVGFARDHAAAHAARDAEARGALPRADALALHPLAVVARRAGDRAALGGGGRIRCPERARPACGAGARRIARRSRVGGPVGRRGSPCSPSSTARARLEAVAAMAKAERRGGGDSAARPRRPGPRLLRGLSPRARRAARSRPSPRASPLGEKITLLCSSACADPQRCHRTLLQKKLVEAGRPWPGVWRAPTLGPGGRGA